MYNNPAVSASAMNSGTEFWRFLQRPMRMKITPRPPENTSKPRVGSRDDAEGFGCIEVFVGFLILRGSKR
jgi:hypothetical protein